MNQKLIQLFKNKVLWKIYIIWFFRRILPLIIFQIAILIIALRIFAKKVFVSKVLENTALISLSSYLTALKYLIEAFFRTNLIVQFAILIMLGIIALLLRDLGKILKTYINTFNFKTEKPN